MEGQREVKIIQTTLRKLPVQEILEKVHYVSVSYTEIQHHQPIKSLNAH